MQQYSAGDDVFYRVGDFGKKEWSGTVLRMSALGNKAEILDATSGTQKNWVRLYNMEHTGGRRRKKPIHSNLSEKELTRGKVVKKEKKKEKKRKPGKVDGSSSDSSDSSDEKKKKKKGNKKKRRKSREEISPDSGSGQNDTSSEVTDIVCSSDEYLSTGEPKESSFWVVDEDDSRFISLIFGVLDEKGLLEVGGRLPVGLKGSTTNEGLHKTLEFLDHFENLRHEGVALFNNTKFKKRWGRALTFVNTKSDLAKRGKETQPQREQHNRDAKTKAFDGLLTYVQQYSTRVSRQNALFESNSFAEVEDISYKRISVNNDEKNDKYLGLKLCCVINRRFEYFVEVRFYV
jgi:hypothetical protein